MDQNLNLNAVPSKQVESLGYAKFNSGPHLLVDIPNGQFTISTKTSEGKQVTFAFVPYEKDGPAQCVDIKHHNSERIVMNGMDAQHVQTVICFSQGTDAFRGFTDSEHPVTLTSVLLHTQNGAKPEPKKADVAELTRLISLYASAVIEATKKGGSGITANKREIAAAKAVMKAILGRMPTEDEVNSIISQ